jgi:hypothetical protein
MKEIFLQIITNDTNMLMAKFLLLPLISIIIFYLLLMVFIRLKFFKGEEINDNFFLNFQFSRIYAINCVMILLNGYWFYLLYNNNVLSLEWNFVFNIENIYLQLTPFVLANVVMIVLYNKTKETILNIL